VFVKFIVACLLAGTTPALAQKIPTGIYAITGTVTAASGGYCPAALKQAVTGAMVYPGITDQNSVLINLQSTVPGKFVTQVTMNAFPPVPAAGLNGWTAASPASPNYYQYQNGTNVAGGTAALLSFKLGIVGFGALTAVQGTMTMEVDSNGPCNETFLLTFQRTAAFNGP
jgi:hypothetical protein